MADIRISALPGLTTPTDGDILHALDDFDNKDKKLTLANLKAYIGPSGATNLNALSDVTITTPATDQVLKYNGSQWINAASPGGGGGTVTQVDGGAGLTGSVTTVGSLSVGQGLGIYVGNDVVAIDRTEVDTWYATAAQGAKADTAVQSVAGTAPISVSGTTTRTVAITAASGSAAGSMSSADYTKLQGIATAATANPVAVNSDITGVTGADRITNMISLTQAEYDAIGSKSATTLYVIT